MLIPKLDKVFHCIINKIYYIKDIDRFISKINITPGLGPWGNCWEWKDHCSQYGYGGFKLCHNSKRKTLIASRIAWELFHGKLIPKGMCVLHKCDNRKCINPNHLKLGTNQDNMTDRNNKERQAHNSGEKCGQSKLTWDQVNEIRNDHATGKYTQRQLADKHNTTYTNINLIVNYKTWRK